MRLSTLFASTVLATVMAASAASAAPYVFTWDPNGTTGGLLSSPGSIFSAHNINVADYATIDLSNPNKVIENGLLVVTSFTVNSPSITTPGLVGGSGAGAPGAIPGASPYQLYFQFTSTSHVGPDGTGLKGAFDTLSYTLFGDMGGKCTFAVAGANCGASGTQLVLATGNLTGGLNEVTINSGGIPGANVNVDIQLGANAGSFFVNPSTLGGFLFETAFINSGGVISRTGDIITIDGGGGNIDLLGVPEPLTLSVFGAGLAGAAALRRRKAKKA